MNNLESSQDFDYYKRIFDILDSENKGEIKYDHLIDFLCKVGFSQTEIDYIHTNTVSYCNSNRVSIKQFLYLMHPLLSRKKIKEDALRNIFNRYDNKKGYIDIHDFISLIISLGDNLNENEIRDYFINANLKRNGKIDFKEFLTIWENIN